MKASFHAGGISAAVISPQAAVEQGRLYTATGIRSRKQIYYHKEDQKNVCRMLC